jgi:glutamine amidotransferase
MPSPEVVVVDYGMGNLLSVRRGLESCGANVTVTSDADAIAAATRVVLPGVGAFANGMAELERGALDEAVKAVAARGTPLFGICLGMQMLFDTSEEFEQAHGLGLIRGRVVSVPSTDAEGRPQKIPHIGWSTLVRADGRADWSGTPLDAVHPGDAFYFVHSFMAAPMDARDRIAHCLYGGMPVTAAIGRDNVFGCQFHPEKSGPLGLAVLKRYLTV